MLSLLRPCLSPVTSPSRRCRHRRPGGTGSGQQAGQADRACEGQERGQASAGQQVRVAEYGALPRRGMQQLHLRVSFLTWLLEASKTPISPVQRTSFHLNDPAYPGTSLVDPGRAPSRKCRPRPLRQLSSFRLPNHSCRELPKNSSITARA